MKLSERDLIDQLLLSGAVTVAQAQQLQATPSHRSVVRDLRDNLLIHLCAYPLDEAGPRSGLAELEAFGRAIAREHDAWVQELDDRVGRHLIDVVGTVAKDTLGQGRWDILLPLGSPSTNRWQAAINVLTRVISSRVVDGLLHPALAADWLRNWPVPASSVDPELPGIGTILSANELFDQWQGDRGNRDAVEQRMMDAFLAGTWP